jgi:Fe-Mn family superoxide dismutase
MLINPTQEKRMTFTLPLLPYEKNALEPHISSRTLDFHHGKHHQTYVDNLNKLIANTELENKPLEEIIRLSAQDTAKAGIFNNAAQVWNHTFYWHSLKKEGGGLPQGVLLKRIAQDFGDYDKFKEAFKQAGATQFGSGWVWLIEEKSTLKIAKTGNADLPMIHGQKALLTCDVWEHAYYLDYQNRRPDYLEVFLNHLVNWDFAAKNLGST